jgi:hypothetical protein
MAAAARGHRVIVRMLLEAGADTTRQHTMDFRTAATIANELGFAAVAADILKFSEVRSLCSFSLIWSVDANSCTVTASRATTVVGGAYGRTPTASHRFSLPTALSCPYRSQRIRVSRNRASQFIVYRGVTHERMTW